MHTPPKTWNACQLTALILVAGTTLCIAAPAAVSDGGDDALDLYQQAASHIVAESPAASNLIFPESPPFGEAWEQMSQTAWDKDATARALVHEARSAKAIAMPDNLDDEKQLLNDCRAVANNVGDAALFQHVHGDDAGAIETIDDLLHISDSLRALPASDDLMRPLVAGGIDALVSYRLMVIASNLQLTDRNDNAKASRVGEVHKLIATLLEHPPIGKQLDLQASAFSDRPNTERQREQFKESWRRCTAGRDCAAISLACHLFQHDKQHWPQSLQDLVPTYLPSVPIDYWGNGAQTFGYVLIKSGLPDGADRPLVYDRCDSRDGLFYRTDEPHYCFYQDNTKPPATRMKGGQFYDIAAWIPMQKPDGPPTTRPL